MRFSIPLVLLACAFAASGAEAPVPAAAVPAPPGVTAAPAPSSGDALPVASIVRTAVAVEQTQRVTLAGGAEVVVDPAASFEAELSARAPDARLVLVDARDDLVPSSGARELAAGTRLTLVPAAPLVPGSRYVLRLDGASRRDLHDEAGRPYSPLAFPILAAGTPPPPEAKRPVRKKRRR